MRCSITATFLNFTLEYAIRMVQENQVRLKLYRTYQLLAYVDDVNLLGDNIGTIQNNTETLTDASKTVGLAKSKYMCMLLSHHQHAGHNRDIKIANGLSENKSQFQYFGTIVTNQN
jgi:hypothetical protein